jgi:hypothetical protein
LTLAEKYDRYLTWIPQHQDKYGFIDTAHCDSLLFSGLVGCVPSIHIDIEAAFDGKLWHRRPIEKSCFPEHSKSTISRDMLVGLVWWVYFNDRPDIATNIVWHALKNWGIMGKAVNLSTKLGRCFIGFGLLSTFAKLSGKWYFWPLTLLPADVNMKTLPTGYAAHIQVLHVLLRDLIDGNDPTTNQILLRHVVREPMNPLFNIATGNYQAAIDVLSNVSLFPEDRLPTSKDRRESWLPQRDFGTDWFPANGPAVQHHGGDFVFCYWLMTYLKGKN